MNRTLDITHPELAKEWHPTKNGNLTPRDVSKGMRKKVWWYLPYDAPETGKHFDFEWQARVENRTKGNGCPYLSGKAVWKGYNDLQTRNPKLASEWHPAKNGSLMPSDVVVGSQKKVWWYVPYDDPISGKHFDFEWQATIASRMAGSGCPYLSGWAVWKGYNDLRTRNPKLASEWHPTKNGTLTPADVAEYTDKKIWWYLPYDDPVSGKHFDFEWQARVDNRTAESDCPYLSGKAVWKGYNDLGTRNPKLASEWHPTKNGTLTPADVTEGAHKKVWWYMPYDDPISGKHFDFEWQATVESRTAGKGCPYLSGKAVWKGYNDLGTRNPKLASEWHPTKNGNLTPANVTECSIQKVWWYMPYDDPISGKHFDFEWQTTVAGRTSGNECPYLGGHATWKGYNDLQTKNPELAKEWHPVKNGRLTPADITACSSKKVWWYMPYDDPVSGKHFNFEWQATVASRASGNGCPYLSGHAAWKGYNDLQTKNPELAKEWHLVKNGKLMPTDFCEHSNKKVWWSCMQGHEWRSCINERANGRGCPVCARG